MLVYCLDMTNAHRREIGGGKGNGSSMRLNMRNPNHCLYCGKQLSIFHLLVDWLYCHSSHKSAHVRQMNELALARLVATKPERPVKRPDRVEPAIGHSGLVRA